MPEVFNISSSIISTQIIGYDLIFFQDSGFYSFHSKHNGQMSPVNNLLNQGEQSPECSFSFSMAGNSPNSSFTGSTNARCVKSLILLKILDMLSLF